MELRQGIPVKAFATGFPAGLTVEDDAVTVDLSDVLADFVDRPTDETPCFVIVDHRFDDSFRLSFADLSNRFNIGRNSEALARTAAAASHCAVGSGIDGSGPPRMSGP